MPGNLMFLSILITLKNFVIIIYSFFTKKIVNFKKFFLLQLAWWVVLRRRTNILKYKRNT